MRQAPHARTWLRSLHRCVARKCGLSARLQEICNRNGLHLRKVGQAIPTRRRETNEAHGKNVVCKWTKKCPGCISPDGTGSNDGRGTGRGDDYCAGNCVLGQRPSGQWKLDAKLACIHDGAKPVSGCGYDDSDNRNRWIFEYQSCTQSRGITGGTVL